MVNVLNGLYLPLKKNISPLRVLTASRTMLESQESGVVGGVGSSGFTPLTLGPGWTRFNENHQSQRKEYAIVFRELFADKS